MDRLNVPVPPILERARGYPLDATWVSFGWSPGGPKADVDDGRHSDTRDVQTWLDAGMSED